MAKRLRDNDWLRIAAMLWRLSPVRVSALILVTVAVSVVPAVQLQLTASAVQSVADAVTTGSTEGLTGQVLFVGLLIVAVSVAAHLSGVWHQYLDAVLRLHLATAVGEQVMCKGTRMDLQDYENADSYDKLQRAFQESSGSNIHQLFADTLSTARELITIVSVSAVLFSWHPWIALLILLAPVPSALAQMWYGKKMYEIEYERAADRRRLLYFQYLTTTDHSFKEVRLFQLGDFFIGRYRELVHRFLKVDRSINRRQSVAFGLLGLISVLASGAALIYAMLTTMGSGQIGQLAGYLQAIGVVQASGQALLVGLAMLFQNKLFVSNLFELFDLPERQIGGGSRPFPARLSRGIEFREVSFTYPGTSERVLDRVSFTMPAGECVALVGQNGAGKTTLVKLLTRLYEPTAGQILIDGVPIQEYDLDDLRRNMGVIFQDYIRYEMSVRHNIGFGAVEHLQDTDRVRKAAIASGADTVVEGLGGGYDAMLGRHFAEGSQLSGGQWQKVALARAFMRGAPVVVLDEPTAAIDAEAEAEIFGRFRTIARTSTSLLVAHRFSTVRIADRIIVIEGGRLIEQGTHAELMRRDGHYAYLFNLQAAGYQPEPDAEAVGPA
ncbi:ABC transporter ATP-binding protein/permease [Crossiella sp. SN42]|uniref:ABC transporter ATP-binding protein n=1 Tax=Crossiella sp. SN42 TaxID=2944808 RepID=UPI00207CBD7C|nr:ABC transporter ATP-binding protein [Crossiella sp. SN42]MCO1577313.1 ABC transporter ATP-binding protein/permease [Crossiella sp. SN42]